MPILNPNWYNLQSMRKYPLDDLATGTGDRGERLKDDILVDCYLRWPNDVGEYAYLGGVSVTPHLVTVTILAATSPDAAGSFVPLAAVSLVQPVSQHVHYNVEPLLPGVAGFLVFGDVSEPFSARFAEPRQSLLLLKCARAYRSLPVTEIRKRGRVDSLTGLVKLLAGSDLQIVKELLYIDGEYRDAIVLRLVQSSPLRNVLSTYLGPCDDRPESLTCDKEGIESINGVAPDCDGNLVIHFDGLNESPYENCGSEAAGVTLDQALGLADVCEPRDPEPFVGADLCGSSESGGDPRSFMMASPNTFWPIDTADAEDLTTSFLTLPQILTFQGAQATGFDVRSGRFVFEDRDGGETDYFYTADDNSRRNVAVMPELLAGRRSMRVTTHLAIPRSASRHNGGLILNYHLATPLTSPHWEYFFVSADQDRGQIRLLRWTGLAFSEIHATTVGSPLRLDDWYHVQADVHPLGADQVAIAVAVSGLTDTAWPTVQFSVASRKFESDRGYVGLGSDRSLTRFAYFCAEDR